MQVFAFELRDPTRDPVAHRYGLLRDDGRTGHEVRLYQDESRRAAQFAVWSKDLIVRRRTEPSRTRTLLLLLFGLVFALVLVGAALTAPEGEDPPPSGASP